MTSYSPGEKKNKEIIARRREQVKKIYEYFTKSLIQINLARFARDVVKYENFLKFFKHCDF